MAERFPAVRALRLSTRGGFCRAANAGIRAASADVVQVLNDDTEVSAGFADAPLTRFIEPRVVAVTPLVLTGDRIDSAGDEYLPAGIARKRGHGRALTAEHLRPRRVFGASGSASFYRRSALLTAGGFDESLVAYFDDVDLSFRLNRLGEVWYEPTSRVQHRVSSSYGPPDGDLLALQSRNEELVFWRNLPADQLLLWLPAHAAAVALKALLRLREGRLLPFLRGRLAAVGCATATLRYRRRWAAPGGPSGHRQ